MAGKHNNCCFQCPDRKAGCHSSCERYSAFLKERHELREAIRSERYLERAWAEVHRQRFADNKEHPYSVWWKERAKW